MIKTFLSSLAGIHWQDIVDIVINSYIIFRLYIIFRGTNAFRVLIGILLLWFFQRVAASLGLVVTSWAIQAISAVAAIIIIVVFRNEIRSVLQTKNLKNLFWGFPHKQVFTPIEIIAESAFELGKKQIGALIILPGREDLKETVQGGIDWDGSVSKEMIMSIFWHDNPVHDGAVIIKNDRITEVGVILPLSHRKDLPLHFGTRHRAALGLAENSDALVILVSEERGAILVAKDGALNTTRSRKELKRILEEHTGQGKESEEFYKREKFKITLAAMASILIVISIWFSFFKGRETWTTLQTPIDYRNLNPKVEILETSVNSVKLNLSGSGPLIKSIRPEQVMVRIDLGQAVVGNNTFILDRKNVSLPPGVKLNSIDPAVVKVLLDLPIRKEFPIQVNWAGKLPGHLILTRAVLEPDKVALLGKKQAFENIYTVYTEKVWLDKIKSSGWLSAALKISPASLKLDPGSKDKVTIKFEVKERKQNPD